MASFIMYFSFQSHEGSIKELRTVFTSRGSDSSARLQRDNVPPLKNVSRLSKKTTTYHMTTQSHDLD